LAELVEILQDMPVERYQFCWKKVMMCKFFLWCSNLG